MRFVIRADAGPQIGGGHVMRCLTLANAARARGHEVSFVLNQSDMAQRVRDAGFEAIELDPVSHRPDSHPPHAHWLSTPWGTDAVHTAKILKDADADWLIWDHYGLDARWVEMVRADLEGLKVLAFDDLDDRALGSDLVLDPARVTSTSRAHVTPATLDGPAFALLRPEFAAARERALARRTGSVETVLIAPGMLDAAGLAPMALEALAGTGLKAEVVMGSAAQSVEVTRGMVATNPNWTLTLDATDMARRMVDADLCIGAGGGTAWERCCLGLPTVVVAVAENQIPGILALEEASAAVTMEMEGLTSDLLARGVAAVTARATELATNSAAFCDGKGASRVMNYVENHS